MSKYSLLIKLCSINYVSTDNLGTLNLNDFRFFNISSSRNESSYKSPEESG
jgi:hypothetical protein